MTEAARTSSHGGERALGMAAFFAQAAPSQAGERERQIALPVCAAALRR